MRTLLSVIVAASLLVVSVTAAEPSASPASPAPAAEKAAPVFQMRRVLDKPGADTEDMVLVNRSDNPKDWQTLHVQKEVLIDETFVKAAEVEEAFGEPRILVTFTDEGASKFADVTSANINKQLAIVINGTLHTAPVIREPIRGGHAAISGAFSKNEALELAAKIMASVKKK